MIKCYIKEPIWKDRTVGIKPSREDVLVGILYKDKEGNRKWPNTWILPASKLASYPIKKYGKGIPVHIVPISDLESLEVYSPKN